MPSSPRLITHFIKRNKVDGIESLDRAHTDGPITKGTSKKNPAGSVEPTGPRHGLPHHTTHIIITRPHRISATTATPYHSFEPLTQPAHPYVFDA